MAEVVGIEGIKAAVAKLKEVVESASVVLQDGKLSFSDVTEIPELYADVRDLVVALQKSQAEVQDLSAAEVKELLSVVIELGMFIAKKFGMEF